MERYLKPYSDVTPVSSNQIFSVSRGVETSSGRKVIIGIYKVCGLPHAAKELEVFERLANSSFFVDLIDKINIPVEDDYWTPRSGDPAMILVSQDLDLDLDAFRRGFPGGRLPKQYVRSLAFQLLHGLKDAHTGKVYLRDVHPVLKIRVDEGGFGFKFSDFTASELMSHIWLQSCWSPLRTKYTHQRLIHVEMTTGIVPFDNNAATDFEYLMSILSLICSRIARVMGTPSRKLWANLKEAIWEKIPRFPCRWKTVSDNISVVLGDSGRKLIEAFNLLIPFNLFRPRKLYIFPADAYMFAIEDQVFIPQAQSNELALALHFQRAAAEQLTELAAATDKILEERRKRS